MVLPKTFGKRKHEENTLTWEDNRKYLLLLVKNSAASLWNKSVRVKIQVFRVFLSVSTVVAKYLLDLQIE